MNRRSTVLFMSLILAVCLLTGCGGENPMEVTRIVLDNGMTVLIQERHSAPVVAINTWVNTGYFNEPDSLTGISHLLEHMFFKGTKRRQMGELREETKRLGGYLNAGTIYEYTHYYTVLPNRFVSQGLEIQSDALWNSAIDSVELTREKKVVIQEIKRKLDNPDALAWEKLMELAFDNHPIRRWRMGTPEQVDSWSRDQLFDYYKSFYRPDNVILAIVGDVDTKEVLRAVRKYYGSIHDQPTQKPQVPSEPEQKGLRYLQMKGDITRTYLKLGFHIPGQLHPDYSALEVLAHILGRGRSSRLSRLLVEREKLASSVSCEAFVQMDFGMLMIEAELEAEDLLGAEQQIFRELDQIRRQSPSDQELIKAKNAVNYSHQASMETARGLSNNLAFFESYGDYRLGERYLDQVARVTSEDVSRVASNYLVWDNVSIVEYRPNDQFDEKMEAAHLKTQIEEAVGGEGEEGGITSQELTRSLEVLPSADQTQMTGRTELVETTVHSDTLACGVRLITRENHSLPLVSVGMYFKGGRVDESKKNSGITRLTLQGSLKGTENRTGEEVFNSIEMLGASLETEVEADYFGYLVKVLSENMDTALEIMADVVKSPVFNPEELQKEKDLLLAKIQRSKDNMRDYPIEVFLQARFPNQSYGLERWGRWGTVQKLDRLQVKRWHDEYFTGNNMTIVVVGDFDSARLKQRLDQLFGDIRRGQALERSLSASDALTGKNLLVESRQKSQTAQALGFATCPYRDDDYYVLKVLQAIASGTGGRFFHQLREKRGLAYTVYGVNDSWDQAGVFYVYIATSPENEEEARAKLLEEFYRFKAEPVEDQELATAKDYIGGMYQVYLETNSALVRQYAKAELIGNGVQDVERYPDRINQITKEQVARAAARYFDPENLAVGVIRGEK